MVVISSGNMDLRARADAALFEKLQQAPVAFVNPADPVVVARLGMSQQQQAAPAPAGWALQFTEIAVRTAPAASQFGQQFGLKISGYGMLQPLRLVMHLVPFHAKHFRQHAFDQVMAKREPARDLASGGREANLSAALHS